MAKKIQKWGTSRYQTVVEKDGWFIGTRQFVCTDSEVFWQNKTAKSRFHFEDPTYAVYGWNSKSSRRSKKEYATKEEAFEDAIHKTQEIDKKLSQKIELPEEDTPSGFGF